MNNLRLLASIKILDKWLERNGWAGYDPYDLKEVPFFVWLNKKSNGLLLLPKKVLRRVLSDVEVLWPLQLRQMFGVNKMHNAKAMGLFAKAYLNLYQITNEVKYRDKAIHCLKWLTKNKQTGYHGACWGYPFNWQSVVMIPKGVPSSVVTCIVGDAFWQAYQILDEKQYLEVCKSICDFLTNDLNQDHISEEITCFSYTPIDDFHVHNANLFVAEFLTRIGKEIENKEFVTLGLKSGEYALSEQNEDGSLYYWGLVQKQHGQKIDHYHSGFEIRCLYGLWKNTGELKYKKAVDKYYEFYSANLIESTNNEIKPKMWPSSFYPVEIHACAEALILNATLAQDYSEAKSILPDLSKWIIDKMQTKEGWFAYRIIFKFGKPRLVRVPYIRWGQAWMLLALSCAYKASSKNVS